MGTWNIQISGHGIHHNRKAEDANVMAAKFVASLREAGHEVSDALFILTNGNGQAQPDGTDDIREPASYLDKRAPTPTP